MDQLVKEIPATEARPPIEVCGIEIKNFQAWRKQIWFWRTHLDIFIMEYFGIEQKDTQRIEAREIGNCARSLLTQSRGYGKTWITALCACALAVLYPGSMIAVVSGTAQQATLVLKKIDDELIKIPNILREIEAKNHAPVQVSNEKGRCRFKNGSKIESYSMRSFLGNRAKIIIVDEAPEVKKKDIEKVVNPVLNTTRMVSHQAHFEDYDSKMISITSACFKSSYYYTSFINALNKMSKLDRESKDYFACAQDYKSAQRLGLAREKFIEEQRDSLPQQTFEMEYGAIFKGSEKGAVFPHELTEPCRVLENVELTQPPKSTSEYIISVDLATSQAKDADNAAICVLKLIEREDGTYLTRLVQIRTFHGRGLDKLAEEVRRLLVAFPNTIKVVFDHRGLGDAFPLFLSEPWIDPVTRKEYPPLVVDTEHSTIRNAIPLLRPVVADNKLNQQLVTVTTVNLEQRKIELPVSSRKLVEDRLIEEDDEGRTIKSRTLTKEEKAIFLEADALQVELGQIVAKETVAGNVIYDTAKYNQHKDRYSALSMGLRYISELENKRIQKIRNGEIDDIGVVGTWN